MTRDQIQTVLDALQGYQPYAQVGTQVRQKTDESIAILQAALAEPSEAVAEVAGDYNTKHIIFLPAGIALEVGDKLFTHPASKPEPLTLGTIQKLWSAAGHKETLKGRVNAFARAVEAAVWEKMK